MLKDSSETSPSLPSLRLRRMRGHRQVARPALCLYFARLQHQLLMAARDDGAPPVMIPLSVPYSDARRPTQGSMKITDVSVADMKHQLFHFRGITLTVNGPWADCCGLYAPPMGRDLFAPSDGGKAALSIVCLRDDGVYRPCDVPRAQSDTFAVAKLPDALHLDCLRGRPIVEVPQIVDRLECMLFHQTFRDNLGNCQRDLDTHYKALEMLRCKRETIQRFFLTALRLGQSLNRSSKRASQAPNGFELASLEKLAETKSTKLPRMSVLHFVLALLSPQEDLALSQEAAIRKTHKVFSDCIEVAQGLYSVQNICQTGMYVRPSGEAVAIHRRRRTLPARSAKDALGRQRLGVDGTPVASLAIEFKFKLSYVILHLGSPNSSTSTEYDGPISQDEGDVDDDDLFFEVMHQFVSENLQAAEDLSEGAFNMVLLYKDWKGLDEVISRGQNLQMASHH
eukprot:g9228.t1